MSMYCEACGRGPWACACGMSLIEKLRTVSLDTRALETRTRRRYYDESSLTDTFGADAKEQFADQTKGKGAFYRSADSPSGFAWRNEKEQRMEPVTEKVAKETLPNLLGD